MPNLNPKQPLNPKQITAINPGDKLTSQTINDIVNRITTSIVGGKNIIIERVHNQIVINAKDPIPVKGGGGGSRVGIKSADNKRDLFDILQIGELGYTTGDYKRLYFKCPSNDNINHPDGLLMCLTHWHPALDFEKA